MSELNDYKARALECVEMAAAEPDPVCRQDHLRWAAAFNTLAQLKERWRRQPLTEPHQASWQEAD
jgi:hypothetical protein